MFQRTDPQGSLFQTSNLLPDEKLARLEKTWAWQFRRHALPMINEGIFAGLYCENNGRPNKSVRTVVGVLVLKDMFNLTDEDALYRLDFDMGWQAALGLTPEDAHCCQKTLHNFRVKLLDNDTIKLLFNDMTARMIEGLGLSTETQRLDSTHIVSNIARLTRLGLFCETIRVFLRALEKANKEKFETIPISLRARYLKDDGTDTRYQDARSDESRRRLCVCARDVYRLEDRFKQDDQAGALASYKILFRLFIDQCEVVENAVTQSEDADAGESPAPAILIESKEVSSASLQTPHDEDVTYSGHKGKGYEVQLSETVGNGEKPEMIVHVEMTHSCYSDERATLPAMAALTQQEMQPKTLLADTNYGSTQNAIECEKRGTDLVTPVRGADAEALKPDATNKNEKTVADFEIDVKGEAATRCPAGHAAESETRNAKGEIVARFSKINCAQCPFRNQCPAKRQPNGTRELNTSAREHTLEKRRRREATKKFKSQYAQRAGIEATNSELKRAHGLGKLRVRGGKRVKLSVFLKVLACNVKRMVKYLAEQAKIAARAAFSVEIELPQRIRRYTFGSGNFANFTPSDAVRSGSKNPRLNAA